jgi:hypothetical protein
MTEMHTGTEIYIGTTPAGVEWWHYGPEELLETKREAFHRMCMLQNAKRQLGEYSILCLYGRKYMGEIVCASRDGEELLAAHTVITPHGQQYMHVRYSVYETEDVMNCDHPIQRRVLRTYTSDKLPAKWRERLDRRKTLRKAN